MEGENGYCGGENKGGEGIGIVVEEVVEMGVDCGGFD